MTTLELVQQAVNKAVDEAKFIEPEGMAPYFYHRTREVRVVTEDGSLPPDSVVMRLRLDFEHADESAEAQVWNWQDIAKSVIPLDLEDIIVNGNVNNRSDALLMGYNGEVTRGQKAVEVRVNWMTVYREYSLRRSQVEYTVYMLVFVRFG